VGVSLVAHVMTLLVIRFQRKEKDVISAHKLQIGVKIYPIASSAKRSTNLNKA
jgi:hypothetical protein